MNSETLLLRQIHPSFVQNGRVTSQAFKPTPKDEKQLSVYDGDQILPEASFHHFTERLKCLSQGVQGVTVQECAGQKLSTIPDPDTFQEHVLIDFSMLSSGEIKTRSKKLKSYAEKRGWLFRG